MDKTVEVLEYIRSELLRDAWIDAENKKKECFKQLLESVKGTKEYNDYKRCKRKAKRAKEDYSAVLQQKGTDNDL